MWHGVDGMGWWMLWGGLMMVLFWGVIIGLIVWGVQSVTRPQLKASAEPDDRTQESLDIARERYARGDISREEFVRMSKALISRSSSAQREG